MDRYDAPDVQFRAQVISLLNSLALLNQQVMEKQEHLEKKLDTIMSHFDVMEPVNKDKKVHDIINKGIEEIIKGFGYSEIGFSVRAHLATKIRKEFRGMSFAEIFPYFRENEALQAYEQAVKKEALGG